MADFPAGLPFITPELPGIGGRIRLQPEHFVVEELPLYPPSGEGGHVFLTLRREGLTTRDLCRGLAEALGVAEGEVGYAGLKDKHARVTQTFSLPLAPGRDPREAGRLAASALPVEVLAAARHQNKLKPGHLLGNRFTILVSDPLPDALARARAVAAALIERGLPNYFGGQRFGARGDNAEQGRQVLAGRGPRPKWLRKLLLSAWQAELFNRWLAARIQDGLFARLIPGDVAKKAATGGLFTVEDPALEEPRLLAGEISHTGPLFGAKLLPAREEAARREDAILAAEGVTPAQLGRAGLAGGRRRGVLRPVMVELTPDPAGLWFSFALPKGSYATGLLREFLKDEPALGSSGE